MKAWYATLIIAIVSILSTTAQSQTDALEGTVSHITSSSVYVRFGSTSSISIGDTLYLNMDGKMQPALVVINLSSLSCMCKPIGINTLKVSDKVFKTSVVSSSKSGKVKSKELKATRTKTAIDSTKNTVKPRTQQIKGRISAASYSNFSNTPSGDYHRMRYTLSLQAKNIKNSPLSAESYVSFVHKSGQWDEIKSNIFRGLKIYNLAVSYDAGRNLKVTAGRKINPRLSNMGAVDGLQLEYKANEITFGALVGSRPHYLDYSINTSLFQYGVFISHERKISKGNIQTTLAFADQRNAGFTDRRFAYLQHSNSLINNLYFFGSAEVDLYRFVNETQDNAPRLSNLYLSLRYKVLSNLSLTLSYSARKNIIYYETYKSFLERLLENETQQGYMAQLSYRPLKKLSLGANLGYRNRTDDMNPSKNAYIYASYSAVPVIDASLTLSATLLETSYLNGNVYSLSLSKDLVRGKIYSTITYRYQDYSFAHSETSVLQHTGEIGLNWNIIKKLSLGLNYEGTFEKEYTFNRVYLQLSKRF